MIILIKYIQNYIYDVFKIGLLFLNNDCSFIDKYGNLGLNIVRNVKSLN